MRIAALVLVLACSCFYVAQADSRSESRPEDSDYRHRTIYFLLTDRFHAHEPYAPYVDSEHPGATNRVNCFAQPCELEEQWRRYWGGDLQGVIEKNDYFKALGIGSVWLTPLMENVRAFEPSLEQVRGAWGAAYHGYWVQNYDRVNPHFGTWLDVEQLSAALHASDIRYIQDITLNHSNPLDTHAHGRLYRSSAADEIFIDSYQNDYDSGTGLRFYKHYQDDPRCHQAATEPDYLWTYWQLHHCLLADLSGYNQRDPTLANYLLDAGKKWIEAGVDDFRLDAIKFVFPEFVARFTHTMQRHLEALERPEPYIVGEWSHGGVGDAKSLRFANDYALYQTNILDFSLSLAFNQFVGGDYEASSQQLSAQGLDDLLHERVRAFHGRDSWQGIFIDNHDQMRALVRLHKLGVTSELERQQRLDLATVLLLTLRGIPIIFYGDEQYLARYLDCDLRHPQQCEVAPEDVNSHDDDPYNRIGMTQWNEDTAAFRIISTLSRLRKVSKAVAEGSYRTIYADHDILVYERRHQNEIVLVAVNRGEAPNLGIQNGIELPPGRYRGLINSASAANRDSVLIVRKGTGHPATLQLGRLSSLVISSLSGRSRDSNRANTFD